MEIIRAEFIAQFDRKTNRNRAEKVGSRSSCHLSLQVVSGDHPLLISRSYGFSRDPLAGVSNVRKFCARTLQ